MHPITPGQTLCTCNVRRITHSACACMSWDQIIFAQLGINFSLIFIVPGTSCRNSGQLRETSQYLVAVLLCPQTHGVSATDPAFGHGARASGECSTDIAPPLEAIVQQSRIAFYLISPLLRSALRLFPWRLVIFCCVRLFRSLLDG